MKKYILHIIVLLLLTSLYGCSKEELQVSFTSNGGSRTLTLTLTHAGMESRATFPGVEALNENLINRVDLFLYPAGGTGSNAVFSIEGITSFKTKDGKVTIELEVPMEEFEDLFPKTNGTQATTCEAYVIVNRPTDSSIPSSSTKMADLKAISITSGFNTSEMQSEFVMDGHSDEITLSNDAITGSIAAERSAAKITLTITNIENVEEDGVTWTPIPSGMQVMFYNGVKKSQVNTTSVPNDGTYFSLLAENAYGFTGTTSGETTVAPYNHAIPFYSYPSDWGETAKNKEAHMILMLPWTNGKRQDNFYYEVPLDDANKKLVRNTYYQISLVVGMLGSTELKTDEIVKLTPTCKLLNWGDAEINANLDQPRYLVAEDTIRIYNQNTVNIPFESSHDVEILNSGDNQIITYHPDLSEPVVVDDQYTFDDSNNDGIFETKNYTENRQTKNKNITISVDNTNQHIVYQKVLQNLFYEDDFDFTEYRTVLTIKHVGNTGKELEKQIVIIQYPAIYGEAEMNTDYKNGQDNSDIGFVWVNGYQGSYKSSNPQDFFSEVDGTSSSTNCPNRLIFNISSTQGTEYVIGDPRTTIIDKELIDATCKYRGSNYSTSNNKTAWVKAGALYDNTSNRGLKYYYPTDVDYTSPNTMESSRTLNMVAPRFMVSSAYGAIDPQKNDPRQYLDAVRKRCASYQEDGYPAGRWRLPTAAELKFLVYLDNELGLIPNLYASIDYWSAHGYGEISGSNVNINYVTKHNDSGSISVRCVYDLWYWEDKLPDAQRDVFTWGDYPRDKYPPITN